MPFGYDCRRMDFYCNKSNHKVQNLSFSQLLNMPPTDAINVESRSRQNIRVGVELYQISENGN